MKGYLAAAAAAAVLAGSGLVAVPVQAAPAPAGRVPAAAPTASAVARVAPAVAVRADSARLAAALRASRAAAPHRYTTVQYAQWYAVKRLVRRSSWGARQMSCLKPMWDKESHWRFKARSPTGKYLGIPQTTASEINDAGHSVSSFMANPEVQVLVGLRYIRNRYGSPCGAWSFWKSNGWY